MREGRLFRNSQKTGIHIFRMCLKSKYHPCTFENTEFSAQMFTFTCKRSEQNDKVLFYKDLGSQSHTHNIFKNQMT